MNILLAEKLLHKLADLGVQDFCVCAGARNSPLVVLLDQARGVQLFHFFDERSAGFFAVGRMNAAGRPMAVITTSGTAVAEVLPAVIEAHYQGLPLIVVYSATFASPKELKGTIEVKPMGATGTFTAIPAPAKP